MQMPGIVTIVLGALQTGGVDDRHTKLEIFSPTHPFLVLPARRLRVASGSLTKEQRRADFGSNVQIVGAHVRSELCHTLCGMP